MGKTEVTQGQWQRIMGSNPSYFRNGDGYPVERVSWNDAQAFIRRLNARSQGVIFRLPTEAEWEYACRAAGRPVAYGTRTGDLNSDLANYESGDGTVPVGSYPPNTLRLHDMSGNVWEWVLDVYVWNAYVSRPSGVHDPIYEGPGNRRVLRGGGWYRSNRGSRCSTRNPAIPEFSYNSVGFRLVRTP